MVGSYYSNSVDRKRKQIAQRRFRGIVYVPLTKLRQHALNNGVDCCHALVPSRNLWCDTIAMIRHTGLQKVDQPLRYVWLMWQNMPRSWSEAFKHWALCYVCVYIHTWYYITWHYVVNNYNIILHAWHSEVITQSFYLPFMQSGLGHSQHLTDLGAVFRSQVTARFVRSVLQDSEWALTAPVIN